MQHLLKGVLNAIKYNEPLILDGLLRSLRHDGTPTEVANHLRHNLDALQRREIIPSEHIDRETLLSLATKMTIGDSSSPCQLGSSTASREYSFVFEDPKSAEQDATRAGRSIDGAAQKRTVNLHPHDNSKHRSSAENDPHSHRRDLRPPFQTPPGLQQLPVHTPEHDFGSANEPVSNIIADAALHASIIPYQPGSPSVTPHALAYYPNPFLPLQDHYGAGQGLYHPEENFSVDYYSESADLQPSLYTVSNSPENSYGPLPIQPNLTLPSSAWMHSATVSPSLVSTEGYPNRSLTPTQPSYFPQQQMQVQTHAPTQVAPTQFHHHKLQQSQRRHPKVRTAARAPPQAAVLPRDTQPGFSSPSFDTCISEEGPGFTG